MSIIGQGLVSSVVFFGRVKPRKEALKPFLIISYPPTLILIHSESIIFTKKNQWTCNIFGNNPHFNNIIILSWGGRGGGKAAPTFLPRRTEALQVLLQCFYTVLTACNDHESKFNV